MRNCSTSWRKKCENMPDADGSRRERKMLVKSCKNKWRYVWKHVKQCDNNIWLRLRKIYENMQNMWKHIYEFFCLIDVAVELVHWQHFVWGARFRTKFTFQFFSLEKHKNIFPVSLFFALWVPNNWLNWKQCGKGNICAVFLKCVHFPKYLAGIQIRRANTDGEPI